MLMIRVISRRVNRIEAACIDNRQCVRLKYPRFLWAILQSHSNGGANKQLIDMLQRSRLFRDYETVFTKATGLPLTLRPLEFLAARSSWQKT